MRRGGHEFEGEHINIYGRVWREERKWRNDASQNQSFFKKKKWEKVFPDWTNEYSITSLYHADLMIGYCPIIKSSHFEEFITDCRIWGNGSAVNITGCSYNWPMCNSQLLCGVSQPLVTPSPEDLMLALASSTVCIEHISIQAVRLHMHTNKKQKSEKAHNPTSNQCQGPFWLVFISLFHQNSS